VLVNPSVDNPAASRPSSQSSSQSDSSPTSPTSPAPPSLPPGALPPRRPRQRDTFSEDFRRFFRRGLAALLPTLITLWLLVKAWDFLWEALGRHLIWLIKQVWWELADRGLTPYQSRGHIARYWRDESFRTRLVGVLIAVTLVYFVGLLVGNLIGRTFWKVGERLVLKIPVIRAIYPAVKQVTDFVLQERKHIASSQVVAVQPHAMGIWSIGLVTGAGLRPLTTAAGSEMVSVFVPSSPTAFSGYVLIVPRESVIELPMTVEEAMRLLVSGGVITPGSGAGESKPILPGIDPATPEIRVAPAAQLSGQ